VIFLDTNICTAAVRDDPRVAGRLVQYGGRIHIPWIVAAELKFGIEKLRLTGKSVGGLRARIERLFAVSNGVLLCTEAVLDHYAILRAELEVAGAPIGASDLWIAAQALAEDALLITDNVREFSRVPGLRIENWLKR
jgi:tRNA(fMet)-specific endonuclease VapC